ncbi:vesicle-trafficking protein SEC22b-like [Callorhinchus milii]|nr:vesicle-trafficking protein SEC22b-like [Callorhinchus milii]
MIWLTIIARVADGLPLAASMQEDEQSGRNLQQYQLQAKQLVHKLNELSPARCSLEAGDYTFHCLTAGGICYLTLCEARFSHRNAFSFLAGLEAEFSELHLRKVPAVTRPYVFIEFDTYIQKLKKTYSDSWSRRSLVVMPDLESVLVTTLEEVLQRGEGLSELNTKNRKHMSVQSGKPQLSLRCPDLHATEPLPRDPHSPTPRRIYTKAAVSGLCLITALLCFWWL